jgi:hypothetical protein
MEGKAEPFFHRSAKDWKGANRKSPPSRTNTETGKPDIASKTRISAATRPALRLFTNSKIGVIPMNIDTKLLQQVHPAHDAATKTGYSHFSNRLLSFLLTLALLGFAATCFAQVQSDVPHQASVGQTTLAIFNDQPMPDGLWPALIATLHEDLTSNSPELRDLRTQVTSQSTGYAASANIGSKIQILRGDKIEPGITVDNSVSIYLLGDCKTTPAPQPSSFDRPQPAVSGVLGWVNMTNGHIEPFIHVDCKRIAQMLDRAAAGRDREQQNQLMARAISRVVLHEWIHIATQSPSHSKEGVTKARFGVQDLLAQPPRPVALQGTGWLTPNWESGVRMLQSPPPSQPSQIHPWGTK